MQTNSTMKIEDRGARGETSVSTTYLAKNRLHACYGCEGGFACSPGWRNPLSRWAAMPMTACTAVQARIAGGRWRFRRWLLCMGRRD
jgi:hypothetical protein